MMYHEAYKPEWGPVSRAGYRREPYVRVKLGDGATVDGKATAWTENYVLLQWVEGHEYKNLWVASEVVKRIDRCESSWRDPYDLY